MHRDYCPLGAQCQIRGSGWKYRVDRLPERRRVNGRKSIQLRLHASEHRTYVSTADQAARDHRIDIREVATVATLDLRQCLRDEALGAFAEWKTKPDKVPY